MSTMYYAGWHALTSYSLPSSSSPSLVAGFPWQQGMCWCPVRCCQASSAPSSLVKEQSLSAKERRKQRNERREQLKEERQPWREEIENKVLQQKKKSPPKGLKHELDMGRLTARGLQWWMMFVTARMEVEVAELISAAVSSQCPDVEFEIYVPVVPTKRKMKDGSISKATQRLHTGCVFARFVMTKRIHDVIRQVPRCKGFFGKKVGFLEQIVMPTSVPVEDIVKMRKKVKEEEDDVKRLVQQVEQERLLNRAAKNAMKEHSNRSEMANVGCKIRITSGPYANFEGCIMSPPSQNKVQSLLMMFGNLTNVEIDLNDVEILEPGNGRDSKLVTT